MGLKLGMKKTYVELNLKKIDLARYSHDSERRNPSFEWVTNIKDKKFKYNFIEIYGTSLKFSPILKQISLFKNKNKKDNPYILKNKKPMYLLNHKTGSLIDIWGLVIWCSEDFKKINKNNDKGNLELYYFSEEPFPYYEKDEIYREEYEQHINSPKYYPKYFYSTSKINLQIMMDKINFENIKKGILNGRKPEKNIDIEGNPFINNLLNFNKIKVEFDPDDRGNMVIGHDVNTGKKYPNKKEIIYGYTLEVNSLFLK